MPENKANDEKKIAEAMRAWRDAFSSKTTEKIMALYADDAFLWGTLSAIQKTDRESIRDYFEKAFVYENREVVFNDYHVRCFGDTAVSSGSYTFSFEKGGEKLILLARFSFVYVRRDGKWLIVEQHSSAVPEE